MAKITTKSLAVYECLDQKMIFTYINSAFEDGDPALIAAAIGDVARARGMTDLAKPTGLSSESLSKALSTEGNPEFATVMKVLHVLNLRLAVVSLGPAERAAT